MSDWQTISNLQTDGYVVLFKEKDRKTKAMTKQNSIGSYMIKWNLNVSTSFLLVAVIEQICSRFSKKKGSTCSQKNRW